MAQSVSLIQNNFISGELSPLLEGRIESPKYQTGLRTCQNIITIRQGGLCKRPGTLYAGNTKSEAYARFIEYTNLSGVEFVLELTDSKLRIWNYDGTIIGGGSPTEVTTPWTLAMLPDISYAVIKGLVWIVHPSVTPRTINGTWTIAEPTFSGGRTFSTTDNYPRSVFFHSGRLGLAGTNAEPNTVFLSRPPVASTGADRFTDFTMGTSYDNAIFLQEADLNGTHMQWAISQKRLIIGTEKSIWMDNGQLCTPATFDMNLIAYTGSSKVTPCLLENIILYAGKNGTSLHALSFSTESGGFQDYDLTVDAEHFLVSPIVDMKVTTAPDPILWISRADGLLVSCTIDFKSGMIAWASHPMGGSALVETLAVVADTLFMVVKRGAKRMVECLAFKNIGSTLQADFHYVDSGLSVTNGSPTATVAGLAHLAGLTVSAWADGAILPAMVVPVGGSLTYDVTFTKIHIGLPIETKIETLRPEIPVQGTSQGKVKGIMEIKLRMYRSFGGSVSTRLGTAIKLLYWISGTYTYGSILPLYTDTKGSPVGGALDADTTIIIVHNDPTPFNLLALIYRVAIVEY